MQRVYPLGFASMPEHEENNGDQGFNVLSNGAQLPCRNCGEAHGFLTTGCRPRPVHQDKVPTVVNRYRGVSAIPISNHEAQYLSDQLSEIGKRPIGQYDYLSDAPEKQHFDQPRAE